MGSIKFFFFFLILTLLLCSCSEDAKKSTEESPKSKIEKKIKSTFKTNTKSKYSITKVTGGYNIDISYTPYNIFKYKVQSADQRSFETTTYSYLRNIYSSNLPIKSITLKAVENSQKLVANPRGQLHLLSQSNDSVTREIASINISKEEFDELAEMYEDPQYKISEYMTYHPFFLVELKLKTEKVDIKNIIVGEIKDNQTDFILTEIRYEPKNVKTLGNLEKDKLDFEENFANIIRYSFEADKSINEIRLIAQTDYMDNRSGTPKSTIATYQASREDFEDIMDNWDNYRYKIYEQMKYTDIFLLDLVSNSKIIDLEFNKTTIINAYYDEEYKFITRSIDTIEKDTVEMIFGLFNYYDKINQIDINFKAKLPAEENDESADGVHKIIHDAYTVSVSKNLVDSINRDKLNNKQILYNFNQEWNNEMIKKNIAESIWIERYRGYGIELENIRDLTINSVNEVTIEFDSCEIESAYNQKPVGGGEVCGEDCVYTKLENLANQMMYEIHPPYLETITFKITKVTLDQTGNEETLDYGEMLIEKDDSTNYWLQTEEDEDLEWFEIDDDLDIDGDNLCQK
jgi:hypothetical protein